jgi:hypothetical protein
MALYHFIGNVAFHAGDKKLVILIQGSKPGKINAGPVHDGDGAAGEFKEPRNDKVRGFGVGYLNESRYVPVVVQKGVELDTSFVLAKSFAHGKRDKYRSTTVESKEYSLHLKRNRFLAAAALHLAYK